MDEVAHIQESYSFFEKFTFIHLFTHFNIDKEIISVISVWLVHKRQTINIFEWVKNINSREYREAKRKKQKITLHC